MDSQPNIDLDFYSEALAMLAETEDYTLILNRDSYGVPIPEHRMLWLISIAVDKGDVPLVGYFNDKLNLYVVISDKNLLSLQLSI
jgi:hypothetical protein